MPKSTPSLALNPLSIRSLPRRAVRLVLPAFLLAAPLFYGCDATDPDPAFRVPVSGTVANTFGRPIAGATLTFDDRDDRVSTYIAATADADGRFSAEVPPGSYTFVTAADGYTASGGTVTIGQEGDDGLVQILSGIGVLTAQFVNAVTGEGAPDISLRCARRQADGAFPDLALVYDFSALSGSDGSLQVFGVPTGALRCRVEGPEFGARLFGITVRRDGTTELPPFGITPPAPEGALRFVLTWGQAPADLDAHLTGPNGTGGRFHVYWVERSHGQTRLDVDDTQSYGPETITVFPSAAGTYRYSIHNWSDQGPFGAQGIAASPARVEVHDHVGLVCTFEAPPTLQAGNAWRVVEVEAHAVGDAFAFDAPCERGTADHRGLGYVSAADAGDLGTFLTDPPLKNSGG